MNKNKFLGILYVVLFLIIITSVYAATKPISGYVNMTGNAAANNASVIVKIRYNESFMGTDYPCNCSTSPVVYSGSDGSYSTNLNNLIFTETCFGGNNVAGNNFPKVLKNIFVLLFSNGKAFFFQYLINSY